MIGYDNIDELPNASSKTWESILDGEYKVRLYNSC